MIRSIKKLKQSGELRFPGDESNQEEYVRKHLDVSTEHDAETYTISSEAFAALKKEIVAEHGERPKLIKQSSPKISRGLGDTLEKTIQTVSFGKVKSCGRCKRRRDKLNKLVSYRQEQGGNDG